MEVFFIFGGNVIYFIIFESLPPPISVVVLEIVTFSVLGSLKEVNTTIVKNAPNVKIAFFIVLVLVFYFIIYKMINSAFFKHGKTT